MCWTDGAEIAHNHQHKIETILCFKSQVVLLDVVDVQLLAGCDVFCVRDGPTRKIYARHIRSAFCQRLGVQSWTAAKVGNFRSLADAKPGRDPFHRSIDEFYIS